jgi:hypothetical protein
MNQFKSTNKYEGMEIRKAIRFAPPTIHATSKCLEAILTHISLAKHSLITQHICALCSHSRTDALGAPLLNDFARELIERAHTRAQIALPRTAPLRAPARQQEALLGDELRAIERVGKLDLLALERGRERERVSE